MRPCPVCELPDGFHSNKHSEHQVPKKLIKEKDWHKKND